MVNIIYSTTEYSSTVVRSNWLLNLLWKFLTFNNLWLSNPSSTTTSLLLAFSERPQKKNTVHPKLGLFPGAYFSTSSLEIHMHTFLLPANLGTTPGLFDTYTHWNIFYRYVQNIQFFVIGAFRHWGPSILTVWSFWNFVRYLRVHNVLL